MLFIFGFEVFPEFLQVTLLNPQLRDQLSIEDELRGKVDLLRRENGLVVVRTDGGFCYFCLFGVGLGSFLFYFH